jgi:hypothetical protein
MVSSFSEGGCEEIYSMDADGQARGEMRKLTKNFMLVFLIWAISGCSASQTSLTKTFFQGDTSGESEMQIKDRDVNRLARCKPGDYFKTTPLICAIEQKKPEIVKTLLDRGADLEKRDEFGSTPLMAAAGGSIEIIQLLLDKGADVNGRGTGYRDDWTPLMEAAAVGNVDAMKLLLKRGADMEARTAGGSTALTIAASNGGQAAATWLVGQGANLEYAVAMMEQDAKKGDNPEQLAAIETLRKIREAHPAGEKISPAEIKRGTSRREGISPAPLERGKDRPKIAVWDLSSGDIQGAYAQDLTLVLVSEISKLGAYEVYSQENVRTLAGWTEERMKLGCTSTQCLTALGQMDISKLVSGRIGKIGDRYSLSLNIFDTQNSKSERTVSEFCRSENELIELVQAAARKLLAK